MKWPKAVEKIENGGRLGLPRQIFWPFQNGPMDPPVTEGLVLEAVSFWNSHSQLQLGPALSGRCCQGPSLTGVFVWFQEKRGPVMPGIPLPKVWLPPRNEILVAPLDLGHFILESGETSPFKFSLRGTRPPVPPVTEPMIAVDIGHRVTKITCPSYPTFSYSRYN